METNIKLIKITSSVVLFDTELYKINKLISSIEKQSIKNKNKNKNFNFKVILYIVDHSNNFQYKNKFKSKVIDIIYLPHINNGYGGGHNFALKNSIDSHFHIFLNPDIYFDKYLFYKILVHFSKNPNCVASSPIIRNIDKTYQLSGRSIPKIFHLILRRFLPNSSFTQLLNIEEFNNIFKNKNFFETPSISGSFIFVRRKVLKKINGFDERYFMYFEDFDLSIKLKKYGKIHYLRKLSIYHYFARGSYFKFNLFLIHVFSLLKFKAVYFFKKTLEVNRNENKIYIVSTSPFIIDNFFINHVKKLRRNNKVTILTNFNTFKDINLNNDFLSAININITRNINIFDDFYIFCKLFIIFLFFRPNMVISLGPKSGIISGLASLFALIKIRIFIFQGQVWANKTGFFCKFLKFIDFLIVKVNNRILSISNIEKDYLCKELLVSSNKINVIGNGSICGVNVNFLPKNFPDSLRNKLNLGDSFIFTYIGRLNPDKGILDLIAAYKNLKLKCKIDIALLIIGPDEMNLNKQILDLKDDSIKIFPYQKDLKPFYRLADCLVLPSYREGLPISILESFASNLPVIVSNIPPLKALVSNKRGLSFEVQNVKSLQSKMNKMLKDSHLRKNIQMNAYRYVIKNFNQDDVVNNYVNYFESLLNE